jgi:hypothetical protein
MASRKPWNLRPRSRIGKGVEFGRNVGGPGYADPLEDLQCLPQEDHGLRGIAGGQGAAAQAGQRVSLVPGAGDSAGEFQGLPVAPFSLRDFTADQVQRAGLVEGSARTQASACSGPVGTGTATGIVPSAGAGRAWRAMRAPARAAACWQ